MSEERLKNWQCWHVQFIGGKKKLVFNFVNPLNPTQEVEGGGTLIHGKYWERRMETVLAVSRIQELADM